MRCSTGRPPPPNRWRPGYKRALQELRDSRGERNGNAGVRAHRNTRFCAGLRLRRGRWTDVHGDPLDQERTVASAIAAGVNYFDTAVLYGNGESERNLGRVLGNLKATNVVVGTKVRLPNAELGRIADAVATSLEGSLGATALRSGWHPFICTRDHRHGRRGYARRSTSP